MLQNINTTAQDEQDITNFVEFQLYPEGKTYCLYHGMQNSVGNYNECEMCLEDYKHNFFMKNT